MHKLKELQYKCAYVSLEWNNESWICTARLPNGVGGWAESHDPVKCIAEVLETIEAHIARGTQPLGIML